MDDFNFDELIKAFEEENYGKNTGGFDAAHLATDKKIETTRKRLLKEYKQAEKELTKESKKYFEKFKKADKAKLKEVKAGLLSNDGYMKWRQQKMLVGEAYNQKIASMAEHLVNVDKQAAGIINGQLAGIYAGNYNWEAYQLEHGLGINTSFSIFDQKSVERLASKNKWMLPKVNPNIPKDMRYSKRNINSALMQGIMQGDSIDDLSKRMEKVVGMSANVSVRNARTAMTGAQNAGRLESYQDAEAMGIKLKKTWLAALDTHTRKSHREISGETVSVNEPFSNELMFPGDPDGDPAEVYNCRCTMISDVEDFPTDYSQYGKVFGEEVDGMAYDEWLESKETIEVKTQKAEAKVKSIQAEIAAKGANKKFSGIWKDDVTYADWESKKSGIAGKKTYYKDEIHKLKNDSTYKSWLSQADKDAKVLQMEGYLAELEEFELNGPKFSKLFDDLAKAEKEYNDLRFASSFGKDGFAASRKNVALWARTEKEYREADKLFEKLAKKVHGSKTPWEHEGYYHYTWGSGPFNQPLAGFRGSWSLSDFVGPNKLDIDWGGYGEKIRGLTSLCQKSKYDFDFWVQSGQDKATIEGFLKIPYGTMGKMTEAELQQFVGYEAEIPQFISGAINRGGGTYTPGDTIINIFVPEQSQALYVLKDGHFGKSEHEMILQRGGKYKITKMYWGHDEVNGGKKLIVDMELHSESGYNLFQQ